MNCNKRKESAKKTNQTNYCRY